MTLHHSTTAALISEFDVLKEYIVQITGLSFLEDSSNDFSLRRALEIRMHATGEGTVGTYFARIRRESDALELKELIDELTIGETHFFRDTGIFGSLETIIFPEILAATKDGDPVRIWSAGCSVGAEPYSLSILIQNAFPRLNRRYRIIGTDINRRFLRQAATGRFGSWTMRAVPDGIKADCFRQVDNEWELASRFRSQVEFHEHNLVADPIPDPSLGLENLHLIICRNVAIYFRGDAITKLLSRFQASLVPGGWLILGHAEVLPQTMDSLATLEPIFTQGGIVYRKRRISSDIRPPEPLATTPKAGFDASAVPAAISAPSSPNFALTPNSADGRSPQPSTPEAGVPAVGPEPRDPAPQPFPAQLKPLENLRHLVDSGRWPDALAQAEQLLDAEPLQDDLHRLHGIALSHLGQHSEAEQAFRRSVYLNHDNLLSHFLLASLLKDIGDTARAHREFRALAKKLAMRNPTMPIADGVATQSGELHAVLALWLGDGATEPGAPV